MLLRVEHVAREWAEAAVAQQRLIDAKLVLTERASAIALEGRALAQLPFRTATAVYLNRVISNTFSLVLQLLHRRISNNTVNRQHTTG